MRLFTECTYAPALIHCTNTPTLAESTDTPALRKNSWFYVQTKFLLRMDDFVSITTMTGNINKRVWYVWVNVVCEGDMWWLCGVDTIRVFGLELRPFADVAASSPHHSLPPPVITSSSTGHYVILHCRFVVCVGCL